MDYSLIVPIGDRVYVKRDPSAEQTPGGLALPDASWITKRTGTVIAVGPGMLRAMPKDMTLEPIAIKPVNARSRQSMSVGSSDRHPMQCKVGDRVLLPHQAEAVRLNPEDDKDVLVVCSEQALLAILPQ